MKTGAVIGECHRRHRCTEFRKFLDTIDRCVPASLDIHSILDNYGTQKTATIRSWLGVGQGAKTSMGPKQRGPSATKRLLGGHYVQISVCVQSLKRASGLRGPSYTCEYGSGRSTRLVTFETVGGSSLNRGSLESFFQSGSAPNFSQAVSSASRFGKLSM